MKSKIARIISTIFIPPVNLLILFIYLAITFEPTSLKANLVILSALIFGFLLPIGFFTLLRIRKKISNNDATEKDQRNGPYIFGIISSLIALIILNFFDTSQISIVSWGIYTLSTILLLFINKYWKISAHSLGIAIPGIIIIYQNTFLFPIIITVLLLVSWSRIALKCHTFAQVVAGNILGFILVLISLLLFSE